MVDKFILFGKVFGIYSSLLILEFSNQTGLLYSMSGYICFIFQDPAEVMFVKGSLPAQRFITAVDLTDSSKLESVSRELWMRIWNRVIYYVSFTSRCCK